MDGHGGGSRRAASEGATGDPGRAFPVRLAAEACLGIVGRGFPCSECVAVCPMAALSFAGEAIRLDDSCVGCGRCAAACPTEALTVDGFAPGAVAGAVRLDCARVPPDAAGTVIVPCLGGLTVTLLLDLFDILDSPVVVMDRRWCEGCPAGGPQGRIWADAVAGAAALLRGAGVGPGLLPVVAVEPLPPGRALPLRPAAAVAAGRRALLGLAVRSEAPVRPRRLPDGSLPAAQPRLQRRRLQILARIAARPGRRLPPGLFARIDVSPTCDHTGLCAALCPTAALRRYQAADAAGLAFHAEDCIGCGRCQQSCPQLAIRLHRAAADGGAVRTLTRHPLRECRCGARFVSANDDILCARCRKEAALARSAALFRWDAQHGEQAGPERSTTITETGRNE